MQCPPPCPAPLPTKTPDKAPARRRPRPRRNAILAAQRAETGRPAAQNGPFRMTERPVSHHAGCQPLTHSGKHCDISLHKRNRRACRSCPCLQPLTHKRLTPASAPPALHHTQYAGHQRLTTIFVSQFTSTIPHILQFSCILQLPRKQPCAHLGIVACTVVLPVR